MSDIHTDQLKIGERIFNSRLFIGTGKFSSGQALSNAIDTSGTEMVTVAMKRANPKSENDSILKYSRNQNLQILPNTSGVRDAEEAIFVAHMAREARNKLVEIGNSSRSKILNARPS